jgi:hypothetical protein
MAVDATSTAVPSEASEKAHHTEDATSDPHEESTALTTDLPTETETAWERDASNPMCWSDLRKWTIILLIAVINFMAYVRSPVYM